MAVYLGGAAADRRLLRIGPALGRVVAAVVALGIVPVAEMTGSLLQLVFVVAVLVAMLVAERAVEGRALHKQFTSGA